MRRTSILPLTLSLLLAGCVGQMTGADDDDTGSTADAAPPGTPDAAPPGTPDAAPAPPEPGDQMACIPFPTQRPTDARAKSPTMHDVAEHLPSSYGDQYYFDEAITWAHEQTHGINSELRNNHNDTGKRINGLYVMEDCGVILVEPDIRKSDANQYVPMALRGYRYDTYMAGQQAWDDTPTYIFDEWVAYTNGGVVGVEMVELGVFGEEWQDGVYGQLEFIVYSMAIGMAVEAGDPTYFASNTQFKEFLAWNARRAMDVFRKGRVMSQFTWDTQDTYFETLRSGAAGADIRAFMAQTWGQAFVDDLLAPL
jgi:hypothetical protein